MKSLFIISVQKFKVIRVIQFFTFLGQQLNPVYVSIVEALSQS